MKKRYMFACLVWAFMIGMLIGTVYFFSESLIFEIAATICFGVNLALFVREARKW